MVQISGQQGVPVTVVERSGAGGVRQATTGRYVGLRKPPQVGGLRSRCGGDGSTRSLPSSRRAHLWGA